MIWKIAVALIVVGFVAFSLIPRSRNAHSQPRVAGNLQAAITGLVESNVAEAFLIVWVGESEDFLQFTASEGIVQLDFPLITERQRQLRSAIETTTRRLGLVSSVSVGSNGSDFLDYDIVGSPQEVTGKIREVFEGVFGVSADEDFRFEASGYMLSAA